jgi:hypothetical protein
MEIGSFIDLDIRQSGEYYNRKKNVARLNSARAGVYYAIKLYDCKTIHIPFYLCPSVKDFLIEKGIDVKYYNINEEFEPLELKPNIQDAILLVNYFGILSVGKLKKLALRYKNVIIDNSSAFYSNPIKGCYNVYSPRKFFGVPDGCYVIGNEAEKYTDYYAQDLSSTTATFLLKRIEFGTSETYVDRMKNEQRIDNSDILRLSPLTQALLKNIDYLTIRKIRKENFYFAHRLYKKYNLIDPVQFIDINCIPMVYPLLIKDLDLAEKLRNKKIYVGRLWKQVLTAVPSGSFEAKLSKYLIPIPIDQRYLRKELLYVYNTILNLVGINSK